MNKQSLLSITVSTLKKTSCTTENNLKREEKNKIKASGKISHHFVLKSYKKKLFTRF